MREFTIASVRAVPHPALKDRTPAKLPFFPPGARWKEGKGGILQPGSSKSHPAAAIIKAIRPGIKPINPPNPTLNQLAQLPNLPL
jgi:hypothetical protein